MVTKVDKSNLRPAGYNYSQILLDHLGGSYDKVFNGELIYPRQLEIHLPGDHQQACNFHCYYCQGKLLEQPLGNFEWDALTLVRELNGRIPYMIYGGAYTEPLLNPFFLDFLKATKKTATNFGIHTNGSLLMKREGDEGFLSTLCDIATSPQDYLSISLDAGTAESHAKIKNLKDNWFDTIIGGIRLAVKLRGSSPSPAIRVCYLLSPVNSSEWELNRIKDIMTDIGVDSLRFSIPYDLYGKDFSRVKDYKKRIEVKGNTKLLPLINDVLTNDNTSKPQIFYIGPDCQDVEKMTFHQCIYPYYQITLGADGYVYKCSSAASPTFKPCRLGKVPNSVRRLNEMILANYDPDFDASICWKMGARCNRMALEINTEWERLNEKH